MNKERSQPRYYRNPWLGNEEIKIDETFSNSVGFIQEAERLAVICQKYYVKNQGVCNQKEEEGDSGAGKTESFLHRYASSLAPPSSLGSLYTGSISAFIYLPLRFALHHLATAASETVNGIDSSTVGISVTTSLTAGTMPISTNEDHVQRELLVCRDLLLQSLEQESGNNEQKNSIGGRVRRKKKRFTLLESETIGALVMLYHIQNILFTSAVNGSNNKESVVAAVTDGDKRLLEYYRQLENHISCHECEVLYGRAGCLQSIAYIRQIYCQNHRKKDYVDEKSTSSKPMSLSLVSSSFGRDMVMQVIESILKEGKKISRKYDRTLTLMWEWHDKVYLGAAHGVVGILHTLLHFVPEIKELSLQQLRRGQQQQLDQKSPRDDEVDYLELIQNTIQQLGDKMCFESSGNLASSYYPNGGGLSAFPDKNKDKLVQWCHGGTGYVLLLIKAYEIFDDEKFLERAKFIAKKVIWPRGLSRKGVGLCHGISGNAYAFLAVYRGVRLANQRRETLDRGKSEHIDVKRRNRTNHNEEDIDNSNEFGSVDPSGADEWLQMARRFASFAIEKLPELEHLPDRPYSLYEGLVGLCALLVDLDRPQDSKFPFYEF